MPLCFIHVWSGLLWVLEVLPSGAEVLQKGGAVLLCHDECHVMESFFIRVAERGGVWCHGCVAGLSSNVVDRSSWGGVGGGIGVGWVHSGLFAWHPVLPLS